jgi:hypothetical protein
LFIIHPLQSLIHEVLSEVIFRVVARWLNEVVVFNKARFPLGGFASQETIEVFEAIAIG